MAHLASLYDIRLNGMVHGVSKCHTTRLRKDIERLIPDVKAVQQNNSWSIVFDEDLSKAVCQMMNNVSENVNVLHKAAKILRQDFISTKQTFDGSFSSKDSVPATLRAFMHMLLDGPGIDQPPPGSDRSKVATAIGEQIIYNTVRRRSKNLECVPRHSRDKETPSALYLAMKLYLQTGSETLIDVMHQRGLCISYDRLHVISTDIANSIISYWETEGIVVPPQAVKGVFTTCGFDNIDYNPSSTTSAMSLHGTCISVQQHFCSLSQQIQMSTEILNPNEMGKRTIRSLPLQYTTMDLDIPIATSDIFHIPDLKTNIHPIPASHIPKHLIEDSYQWLEHVKSLLEKETLDTDDWISWAAYYASTLPHPCNPPAQSHMLPLFTESPTSSTMVWHGMKIIQQITSYLNPGQIPIMVADQPLFTLAKKLQWKFPESAYGENSLLVMLGPMHTEKMLWSVSGDWLDGSGWTTALTNSGITSSGKAESYIGVHHICRTRYIHQVSVAALSSLLRKAYDVYHEKEIIMPNINQPLCIGEWVREMCSAQPQALYWYQAMELDLLILQVRYLHTF